MKSVYGCDESYIKHYDCQKITSPIEIDGNLDKTAWYQAVKSPRFVDMVTGIPGFLDTRCACLWDDHYLYVGFWIEEPNVCARYRNRDDRVYLENDVEIFIGGDECYYEFQINALGTIYEVFYIWQNAYRENPRFQSDEFNLVKRNVDVLGGFQDVSRFEKHPKGARWAFRDWDMDGIKTAVKVHGKMNDPYVIDKGWDVEIAFPWKSMKSLMGINPVKMKEGDTLRMKDLSYNGHSPEIHPGWALNRHGIYDSHIPEMFSYIHLTGKKEE